MVEIIKPQDPALRAIAYLTPFYPSATIEVPPDWAWDDELVVVTDVGGSGDYDRVLDDVLLAVDVSHPDLASASSIARDVHGLLRAWQFEEPGVYWRRTIQRPTFTPDDETRVPAYSLTVNLAFRAETVVVNPLTGSLP